MDPVKFDILLDAAKRKLNITWYDVETEQRVSDILETAIPTMRHKLGVPDDFDWTTPGQELNLLLSWVLYEWNHASGEFDDNYRNDILQARQKWEVAAYADAQTAPLQ